MQPARLAHLDAITLINLPDLQTVSPLHPIAPSLGVKTSSVQTNFAPIPGPPRAIPHGPASSPESKRSLKPRIRLVPPTLESSTHSPQIDSMSRPCCLRP